MAKTINRVDIKKDNSVYIEYETASIGEGGRQVQDGDKKTRNQPAHEDLQNAFIKMIPHLMFGCHFLKPNHLNDEGWFDSHEYLDLPEYDGITVTGVMYVGKDHQAVKLIGRKTTVYGDVIPLNSPILYFAPDAVKHYEHHKLLSVHVYNLVKEAEAYLKGKFAPHYEQATLPVK